MATRDELQRLHDGELPAEEAERLRKGLSAEDLARLRAMDEVGEAVRAHLMGRAGEQPLDVWAAISDQLEDRGGEVVPMHRRGWVKVTAAIAAAAAIAASALWLFLRAPALGGANVESVDFGDEAGLLFQVEGSKTTVIWQTTNEEHE